MKKYLTVFSVDWQNQFTYRLNFVLWRFRNVLRVLMTYFLWLGVFSTNKDVFGYSQNQMFSYVFMVLLVQSIIFSAPSADNIGGEISNGDLSNYLVKPVSYLRVWFVRDLSSKLLNISFAIFEVFVIWFFLKPQLIFSTNPASYLLFLISIIIALFLYFLMQIGSKTVAFWAPEYTWGLSFFLIVLIEIFGGLIFPLDLLPSNIANILNFTPFPYLLYYPIQLVIGKITGIPALIILFKSLIWLILLNMITRSIWRKGLKNYGSEGR